MNLLDGKTHVVIEDHCKLPWAGGKNGKYFRCGFCGHKFIPGNKIRWIFSNHVKGASGNPFTCDKCDCGDDSKMILKYKSLKESFDKDVIGKYWSFMRIYFREF